MNGFRFDANISILFTHLPLLSRPAAAAAAGFRAVEMWWPFDKPVPADRDVELLRRALEDAGTQLVALNLDGGNTASGDRGLISIPSEVERVQANAQAALGILDVTGCTVLNALYGNRIDGIEPRLQDEVALANLCAIARQALPSGVTVALETLNSFDSPHFPLTSLTATEAVLADIRRNEGIDNVGLLLDVYHLSRMKHPLVEAVLHASQPITHVQLADDPGRGRPGTGSIEFDRVLSALHTIEYKGYIGLEYEPTPAVPDSLPESLAPHAA